jgi:hypothetical protein
MTTTMAGETTKETNGKHGIVVSDLVKPNVGRAAKIRIIGVEGMLFLLLATGGGLLAWGGNFAHNYVHDQLVAQQIRFPAKGSPALAPKEFPGLQRYAGQLVDNGPKAKAYSNQFIAAHLKKVAGGQTYAQVSSKAQADPTNATLQAQRTSLFQGETLRGLLLNAWGWSVAGTIAADVSWFAFAGALVVFLAMVYGLAVVRPRD